MWLNVRWLVYFVDAVFEYYSTAVGTTCSMYTPVQPAGSTSLTHARYRLYVVKHTRCAHKVCTQPFYVAAHALSSQPVASYTPCGNRLRPWPAHPLGPFFLLIAATALD